MFDESLGSRSKSGVFLFNDYRDNIIIDRNDPALVNLRSEKQEALRSENSEDAITWNVFRSLRRVASDLWFPELFKRAFPGLVAPEPAGPTIQLWKRVSPPPSFRA